MFEQTNVSSSGDTSGSGRLLVVDINHFNSMSTGSETSPATTFAALNSGVPTQTTPTLTPTTLRTIEQYLLVDSMQPDGAPPVPHENEAGFVPPLVPHVSQPSTTYTTVDTKGWGVGTATVSTSPHSEFSSMRVTVTSSGTTPASMTNTQSSTSTGRRSTGGRRPNNTEKLTPEEDEKRQMRRERNKLAAARCRKRRMDHTSLLENETDDLEQKKQMIQNEIKMLQCEKEELEFILEAHKANCKWKKTSHKNDIFQDVSVKKEKHEEFLCPQQVDEMDARSFEVSHALENVTNCKRKPRPRPTSLAVSNIFPKSSEIPMVEDLNVPMSTPSAGMFSFDSLLEGGTGLTPISSGLTPVTTSIVPTSGLVTPVVPANCSVQQRNNNTDLSSPEAPPPKLVSL